MNTNSEPATESRYVRHRRGVVARLDEILAELADLRAAVRKGLAAHDGQTKEQRE
jgi:hypothetical protein